MKKNTNTNVAPIAAKANTNTRTRAAPDANSNTNTDATNRQRENPHVAPQPRSSSTVSSTGDSSYSNQPRQPPKRGRPRKDSGHTKPWVIGLPAPRALDGLPPLYPPPTDSQAPAAPPAPSQAPPSSPAAPIPPAQAAKKDVPAPPVVSALAPPVPVGPACLPQEVTGTLARPALVAPAPVLSDPVVPMVPTPAPPVTTSFFLSSLVSAANLDLPAPASPDHIETLTPPMPFFLDPLVPCMYPDLPNSAREPLLAKPEGPSAAPQGQYSESVEHKIDIGTLPTIEFKPHVITVPIGEDILERIMSFTHEGHNSVCVLSATGSVSSATIDQLTFDHLNVCTIYEGFYDIVRLNGAYIMTEINGHTHRKGGLKVTLANTDCTLFGGEVTGPLIAASGVQLVLGTYLWVEENFSEGVDNPIISGGGVSFGGGGATAAGGAGGGSVSAVDGGAGSTASAGACGAE